MGQEYIAAAPKITFPRSAFYQNLSIDTSWKHGQLIPVDCRMVMPGQTLKLDLGSLIRMGTPAQAFFGEIECEINAFYCPMRLLWAHTEEFFGANKNAAGAPTTVYTIPHRSVFSEGVAWDSVSHYLGKPVTSADWSKASSGYGYASVLKERGYWLIWSDFYRASMIQNPFIMINDDSEYFGTVNGTPINFNTKPAQVCKSIDVFTSCLESPQYGSNAVTIPLGTYAPVKVEFGASVRDAAGSTMKIQNTSALTDSNHLSTLYAEDPSGNDSADLYADLGEAAAAPINLLRYSIAVQRFLELSNYAGSYYWSQNFVHYGVTPADSSLQRPQRLGTINFTLNVSPVTATANTEVSGSLSPVGQTGAISVTGNNKHLFTKAFDEFGFVYVMLHTRVKKQTYTQGLLKEDTIFNRMDLFSNELARIGDVAVKKKELFLTGDGDVTDEKTFGYNEAWYEWKYSVNRCSGVLDPNSGAGVAVNVWTLANKFSSAPQLNASFVEEDRKLVADRLVAGMASNYDYVGHFNFKYENISEVPIHSLPGLMDHVGDL